MMKGKVSLKTVIILVILALVGVLSFLGVGAAKTYLSGASAGADPKSVLATSGEDGKSATVTFSTDKPVQTVIEYGTTPASLLLRSLEADATTNHSLNITPLKAGTSYYFRIRVGEDVFDNSGIPYSFKTKGTLGTGAAASPSPRPTSPPAGGLPTQAAAGGTTGCNRTTDYNSDGVVNSLDFVKCMTGGGNSASPRPTTASSSSSQGCDNVDFDKNGIINSIDRIKCLQAK